MSKTSEEIKSATIICQWAENEFPKKNDGTDTSSERNRKRLEAISLSLDAASRLFREHGIPIPLPFRVLRKDLHEAIAGRSPQYFRNDLVRNPPKNRPPKPGSISTLQCYSAVAVDLFLQANEGGLTECCKKVARILAENNISAGEKSLDWKTVKNWRIEITRKNKDGEAAHPYEYINYLSALRIYGSQNGFPKVSEQYKFIERNIDISVDRTPREIANEAEKLLIKTAKGCPDLLSPAEEIELE